MDLAILAADSPTYDLYAINIRKEYIHYCDKDYKIGRIQILNNLNQKELFKTSYF